jgi:hypothetical protein
VLVRTVGDTNSARQVKKQAKKVTAPSALRGDLVELHEAPNPKLLKLLQSLRA